MCVLRDCIPNKSLYPLRRESGYAHHAKGVTTKCAVTPFTNSTVLYYSQIQLTHLLAPFPLWRPLIPFNVAPLRRMPFALARMKNSLRILCHFHLRIVLRTMLEGRAAFLMRPAARE